MRDLVGPRGELFDFERRHGDEPPSRFADNSVADRWGSRKLFQINQAGRGPIATNTMVDIRTLQRTVPINLQLRFALADGNGTPILPFSPRWPFAAPAGEAITVRTRRSVDPLSDVAEDTFVIDSSKVFPWDTITTAKFGVEVSFQNFIAASNPAAVWIEVIATQVADIATRNRIEGWGILESNAFVPVNVASVQFLAPRADRQQFIIVNTSTDGDLYVNFDAAAVAGPPPAAVIVLPRNMFASFSSQKGFTGSVHGVWSAGAVNGGALVTSGVYGTPNITSR